MDNALKVVATILGAIIAVAIVAVIVSNRSPTPEAIGAIGNFYSRVIRAAVDPAATAATNGNPEDNIFGMPSLTGLSSIANGIGGGILDFPNFGGFSA
jgi:hypothetical protein